jgi:hypothetical protein
MTTNQAKSRRGKNLVSFKDVQLAYLLEGIESVGRLWATGTLSKATVRKALKKLRDSGENVEQFDSWMLNTIGPIGRGRSGPTPGETRSYKTQQIKAGGPFLRLPLDSIGVHKGDPVRVAFDADSIVVQR